MKADMISIVIPNKNNFSKLKKCLESINKSDFKEYEIIVIDDGSDKETKQRYSEIKSAKLKVLFNAKNRGPSFSRNLGANEAKGDIILFIDSDCYVFQDTLNKIDKFFKENKNISCLGGTYTTRSASGKFFDDFQSLTVNYFETKKIDADYLAGHCFAVRKDVFKETNGFFIGKSVGRKPNVEDIVLSLDLKELGEKLIMLPELLVQHDPSYNLLKSVKNAYNKSFIWIKLSSKLGNIGGDFGAGGRELKISIVVWCLFFLSIILGIFYPRSLLLSFLFLFLNFINLFPMIKRAIKINLGFGFYLYFTFIYSFVVGLGGAVGLFDYYILNNKRL